MFLFDGAVHVVPYYKTKVAVLSNVVFALCYFNYTYILILHH